MTSTATETDSSGFAMSIGQIGKEVGDQHGGQAGGQVGGQVRSSDGGQVGNSRLVAASSG
jgi:hypothetical protein